VRAVLYVDKETGTTVGEVPDPTPGPADVIVAVEACGLCGSDVHSVQNGNCAPGSPRARVQRADRRARLGGVRVERGAGRRRVADRVVRPVPDLPRAGCRSAARWWRTSGSPSPARTRSTSRCRRGSSCAARGPACRGRVARRAALGGVAGGEARPGRPGRPGARVRGRADRPLRDHGAQAGRGRADRRGGPLGRAAAGGRRRGRGRGHRHREISVAEYAKQSGTLFAATIECSPRPGPSMRRWRSPSRAAPSSRSRSRRSRRQSRCSDHLQRDAHRRILRVLRRHLRRVRRAPRRRAGAGGAARLRAGVADDTPDALRRLQAPGSLVRIISRPSA